MTRSRHIPASLCLAVVGAAAAVGVIELGLSIRHLARQGSWSRAPLIQAREHHPSFVAEPDAEPDRARQGDDIQLHPLFGYVYAPGSVHTNNYGFRTTQDFELTEEGYSLQGHESSRTLVVGVFGGSFAQQMVLAAGDELADGIEVAYPGREPVVVNFAIEGHAIPQTAFVFLYFRSMVDIAVFVDGYNELWNYLNNNASGCPPEYAKAVHYLHKTSMEELTPEKFQRTSRLLALRRHRASLTRLSLRVPFRNSVLAHSVWTRLVRRGDRAIATEMEDIESSYLSRAPFMAAEGSGMVRIAAHQWGAYHGMIHTVSVHDGILDLHLLQPNIYAPGSKKWLCPGELRVLESDRGSSRGWCVATGYPLLLSELESLHAGGALCVDLTDVFYGCDEERWIDVCHTNPPGYRTIVARILSVLPPRLASPVD